MPKTYALLVLNGANLRHLGRRQPEIYGTQGMEAVPALVEKLMGPQAGRLKLNFAQYNAEGAMIDRLEQAWEEDADGIIINAGAYTHTSLALADCLAWIKIPAVEVHLSNPQARAEAIRHKSLLAGSVLGCISGFGVLGYALAAQALFNHLEKQEK